MKPKSIERIPYAHLRQVTAEDINKKLRDLRERISDGKMPGQMKHLLLLEIRGLKAQRERLKNAKGQV